MGSFEAIAEYLRRPNHLDQKDIQLTEREFNDLIPILRDAIRRPDRKLRTFTYDPMRGVLTLIAMSRPLHDAVRRFLSKTTMNWMAGGFLSETELEHVSYSVGSLLLRIHPSFISSKLPAWTKYPDGALFFEAPSDDDVPVVIWKVGFSENYAALVDDATQWLCRSEGAVRLMILVKLDEDTTALQDTRKTNACKQRLRKLAVQFGNEAGKSEFGIIDSQHQPEDIPDAEQYECLKDKLVVEDWVGPLSAFLEFWVLSASGKAVKRGKRTTILPRPPRKPQNPKLLATDIIPPEFRGQDFDSGRSVNLNMDLYRDCLEKGKKKSRSYTSNPCSSAEARICRRPKLLTLGSILCLLLTCSRLRHTYFSVFLNVLRDSWRVYLSSENSVHRASFRLAC